MVGVPGPRSYSVLFINLRRRPRTFPFSCLRIWSLVRAHQKNRCYFRILFLPWVCHTYNYIVRKRTAMEPCRLLFKGCPGGATLKAMASVKAMAPFGRRRAFPLGPHPATGPPPFVVRKNRLKREGGLPKKLNPPRLYCEKNSPGGGGRGTGSTKLL